MLKKLTTVARHPKLLPEYMNWIYQKNIKKRKPVRILNGVSLSNFVDFSEYHSVAHYMSKEEQFLLENFDYIDGDIVDIGANLGLISILMAKRYPARRIFALEPAPSTYVAMEGNIRLNHSRVECRQMAIGEQDGSVSFYDWENARAVASIAETPSEQTVEVPCSRLDTFVEREHITSIALLKVDTEGFETAVFRGARKTLSKIKPEMIYFEIVPALARRRGFGVTEAAEMLADAGYELFQLEDNHTYLNVTPAQAGGLHSENWIAARPYAVEKLTALSRS